MYEVVELERLSDITSLLTDSDKEHMVSSMEAAARGDAVRALEHEQAVSILPNSPNATHLREVAMLGEEAPGWLYSRWIVQQAYRWLLISIDHTIDTAVLDSLTAVNGDLFPAIDSQADLVEIGTRIAASDWAAQQLAVYEYDGLRKFLDVQASEALVARADSVREWVGARMGGYRLERTRGGRIEVTDLSDGTRLDVLDIGALSERHDGSTVIGRLVPVAVPPHRMFEGRPLSVHPRTAEEVASEQCSPDGKPWLHVLGDARDGGREPAGFTWGQATLLSSDLLLHWAPYQVGHDEESPAPRFRELRADGLSAAAANGVMVCEMGPMLQASTPEALDRFAAHLSAALMDAEVFEAARRFLGGEEHREFWSTMAERVPEPVRNRCLTLAAEKR